MISPGHDDTLHFMRQLASNLHQILDGLVHLDLEAGSEAGIEARRAQPADGGQQPPLLGAGALHQGRVQGLAHLVSTGQVKYCDVTLTRTQGRNSSFMAPREVKEVPAWRSNRGRHPVWKPYGAP